ncbi:hypothetical protein ABVK25_011903 [Lepraria finkii]|uniref:Uncharacterized protein n=1 Tax=Lepraria finkii TaxID=1340010 RepID=A0ABR4AM84_9LECA
MFAHLIYTTALALSIATINCAPQPRDNSLPDCAAAPAECKCPAGTTLQPSSTYALIGASAKDVKAITGSFFETAWFGSSPQAVSGYDNKPGATRTFSGSTSVGTYTFVEKLVSYKEYNDGSFTMLFEQDNGPIPYKNGTGSFSGYWDTLSVKYADAHETLIYWDIYVCWTGVVSDNKAFHESAINNVTSILKSQGKLLGHSEPPVSF